MKLRIKIYGINIMCKVDNYILRITSVGTNVTQLQDANDKYYGIKFRTPDFLRKKGKCKITVVNGNINTSEGDNDVLITHSRSIFMLTSNIPQLGYYTETRGPNTVLGTGVAAYVGADATDKVLNVNFDDANPLIFICPELPPEIVVERMCYDNSVLGKSLSDRNLEFHATLSIEFYEDMTD